MNLDNLQINAVIRSGWQAVDLGFLMARAWWGPLFCAGLVSLLPLSLIMLAVFHQAPLWALALVWWLKPFWERLPLFIASRLLFDDASGIWVNLKSLPLKDALPWLLWRRLSLQRAFDNPVTVLEELTGRQRSRRLQILHGKYSDVALANQIVCFCVEVLLAAGLVMLLEFFMPNAIGLELYDDYDNLNATGHWTYTIAGMIALTLVMPFHTMAGFALYLNRRIELEAWDIEISFRSLANRKRQENSMTAGLSVILLLTGSLLLTLPGNSAAAIDYDRESAAATIAEILQGEDFGQEKIVRKWRFKNWTEEEEEADQTFPQWMIDFVDWWEFNGDWFDSVNALAVWLKLILVMAFVALLTYFIMRYRGPLSRLMNKSPVESAPEVLFGLDVTPESLPADVPAQVMQLWDDACYREAMGLLYRASLSRLIEKHELAFRASFTEAECAALVTSQGIDSLSDFFWQLTNAWRRLAYGHQRPAHDTITALCRAWSLELADVAE